MTAKIIDGRAIAKKIRAHVKKEITRLKAKHNETPTIATIKIGENPESDVYLKLRDNACEEVGIQSKHHTFSNDVSQKTVTKTIEQLNQDSNTHGIILQFPLPKGFSQHELLSHITPAKDVEGLNPVNLGKTMIGDEQLVPCTPLSVVTILDHENIQVQGKNTVIINHSTIVGKPLAMMLLNRNATISICHVYTDDIQPYTEQADIIITGTGVPDLIQKQHVKQDAVVVDVGIIKTKEGIRGDVDFSAVKEKASKITPVPGGVGPVTVASSVKNMMQTFKNCME